MDSDHMNQVSAEKIKKTAKELNKAGNKWHFHILTPGCIYNQKVKFALVLEDVTDDEQYVTYAVKKPSKVGKELVKLLHGDKVADKKKKTEKIAVLSLPEKVQDMVARMKKLNQKKKAWHHHLFFPECAFNGEGKWRIVFEDPESGDVKEYESKLEPKKTLSVIEPLFYEQEK